MTQTLGAKDAAFLPVAENVRKELDLLLAEIGKDDHLLIALAGHGVQFQGEKDVFFCPADARLKDKNRLISLEEIFGKLRASRPPRK